MSATLPDKKKIKEQIIIEKIYAFCKDLYKACKDGYKAVGITELIKNHKIHNDIVPAIKNLNIAKHIGQGRDVLYYWSSTQPDGPMMDRIKVEMGRIALNRELQLNISTKPSLIKIIRPIEFTVSQCMKIMRSLYVDYPENTLIDMAVVLKKYCMTESVFDALVHHKYLRKSSFNTPVIRSMYVWNSNEPTIEHATVVHDYVMNNQKQLKMEEKFNNKVNVGQTLSPDQKLDGALREIRQTIETGGKLLISKLLADHGVLTNMSTVLKEQNIIKFDGEKYTWNYPPEIDQDLVTMLRTALANKRQKYFNSEHNTKRELFIPKVQNAKLETKVTSDGFMSDLAAEERVLQAKIDLVVQSMPEYDRIQKIRQVMKLASELVVPSPSIDSRSTGMDARILEYINGRTDNIRTSEVIEKFTEIKGATVSGYLTQLSTKGLIIKLSSGIYKRKPQ